MTKMDSLELNGISLTGNGIGYIRQTQSADTVNRNKPLFQNSRNNSAIETRVVSFDVEAEIVNVKNERRSKSAKTQTAPITSTVKDVTMTVRAKSGNINKKKMDTSHLDKLEERIVFDRTMNVSEMDKKIERFLMSSSEKHVTFDADNNFKAKRMAKVKEPILPQIPRTPGTFEHPLRAFSKHKVLVLAELFYTSKKADLGGHMVSSKAGDFQEEHERELQRAVDDAEERATRELKAALKRLRNDKEDEKNRALKNQKDYYEKLARRIEEQRNRAEEERERELTKKFMRQQDEALERQWQECEEIKKRAIEEACEELTRKLRIEFNQEKDEAVAEALRIAKEKYLIRERNVIEKTRRECEEEARREAARVAEIHQQEIDRCNQRYDLLERKWLREKEHRINVEQDFRALQEDYRRFMDYTDGMFHSDYLMQLRHLGQKLAEKQLSPVTYDDLEREYDFT